MCDRLLLGYVAVVETTETVGMVPALPLVHPNKSMSPRPSFQIRGRGSQRVPRNLADRRTPGRTTMTLYAASAQGRRHVAVPPGIYISAFLQIARTPNRSECGPVRIATPFRCSIIGQIHESRTS
jgi:hypothetical protein